MIETDCFFKREGGRVRKISAKIFWKRLVPEKLTPEEQAEIWRAHSRIIGNETVEDIRETLLRYGALTAKVIECHCPQNFTAHASMIWGVLSEFMGTKGVTALVESSEAQRRDFRKRIGTIACRFARQRRCHFLRNGSICYCDEHNHSEIRDIAFDGG